YLTNNASLSGFTLANGYVNVGFVPAGAGVFCTSPTALVSNCVLSGNQVYYAVIRVGTFPEGVGGGAYGGTLDHLTVTYNMASEGGGAANCTLNNCTLSSKEAAFRDYDCQCVPTASGGGAFQSTLNNCTLIGNSVWINMSKSLSSDSAYASGGGAAGCRL